MITPDTQPFRTTRRAFAFVLTLVVLGLLVYGWFLFVLRVTTTHTAVLEKQVQILQTQEKEVGTLKKELSTMEERQQQLSSYFIDVDNIVPFLETVEGYGRQTNVTTKFDTFDIHTGPSRLDVSLVADGNFADIYRFFSLLENTPYATKINTMSLQLAVPLGFQPQGSGPHSSGWEAHATLSVFSITGVK